MRRRRSIAKTEATLRLPKDYPFHDKPLNRHTAGKWVRRAAGPYLSKPHRPGSAPPSRPLRLRGSILFPPQHRAAGHRNTVTPPPPIFHPKFKIQNHDSPAPPDCRHFPGLGKSRRRNCSLNRDSDWNPAAFSVRSFSRPLPRQPGLLPIALMAVRATILHHRLAVKETVKLAPF